MPKKDKILEETLKGAELDQARSIINKPIPPVPEGLPPPDRKGMPPISIMLFYQYIEPAWTPKQHKAALSYVNELGRKVGVTGRGRCATEGLNCTITGTAEAVRAFAQGLRDWDETFNECDFKFTDGLPYVKRFKSLTIQKKEELVAYGLPPEMAPALQENSTVHLEADDYHKKMAESNTVIIDVRNRYETEIGRFKPPPGGAEFIDPKVRNSREFPKWLNSPEVQEKLQGKQVMMYCTGGIRCERFSALLAQCKKENPEFKTEGEFMVRGGIERYMRTFPEGGFWVGKNYLFDKRQEQVCEKKPKHIIEEECKTLWGDNGSVCCVCQEPCTRYRGAFKCVVKECAVPVIVCDWCKTADPAKMKCPLCLEGVSLRELASPKLQEAVKRKAEATAAAEALAKKRAKHENKEPHQRLFVGGLPLVMDVTKISSALGGGVELVHWITDRETGVWYGSTFVQMISLTEAKRAVKLAHEEGIKIGKRKIRVNFAPPSETDQWPPPNHVPRERPPIPM